MAVRYAEKFTSIDGSTTVYTFPTNRMEYSPSQSLRSPVSSVVGAEYAFRHRGFSPGFKAVGQERIRAVYTDTEANIEGEIDEARSELWKIGLGKLWTLDSDASRRWCYAEVASMPEYTVSYQRRLILGFTYVFNRLSDWFASSQTTATVTVSGASPETFNMTNAGNAPVYWMEFRLRSSATVGFSNPALTNTTNGYVWSSTRDSVSADSELKVDSELGTVEFSNNDGSSYADDYALFSLPASQVGFMRLEPGVNAMSLANDGTPNSSLEYAFYAAYH